MSRSELQALRQFCADWIIGAYNWKYILRLDPRTREVQVNPAWWNISEVQLKERMCEVCLIYCAVDDDADTLVEGGPLLIYDAVSEHSLKEYPASNLDLIVKRLDQYREADRPARTVPRNRQNLRLSLDPVRARLQSK